MTEIPEPRDWRDDVTDDADQQEQQDGAVTRESRNEYLSRARAALAAKTPVRIGAPPLPEFPVETFPVWIRDAVITVTEAMQVPADLAAMTALGAISAAVAGAGEAEVRPGWRETLSLFVVVAAESSERKSPTQRQLIAPLRDAEDRLREAASKEHARLSLNKAAAEEAAMVARTRAIKIGADQASIVEALDLERIASEIDVPPPPRVLAGGDITPEAINSLLVKHRRISLISAEGGIFGMINGRYSSGMKNLDGVLSGYSGDRIETDRKHGGTEVVDRPALVMVLAIQPVTLAQVVHDPELVKRGLTGRLTLALPAPRVGHRLTGRDVPLLSDAAMKVYGDALSNLAVDLFPRLATPATLRFEEIALDELYMFAADVEKRLRPGGDLRATGPWGGKFVGQVVRIAALLHLAEAQGIRGLGMPITLNATKSAIQIGGYLVEHAMVALVAPTGTGESAADAEALEKLRAMKTQEFSTRDLQRKLRGKAWNAAAVRDSLESLAEMGWVAQIGQHEWMTHPQLHPPHDGKTA